MTPPPPARTELRGALSTGTDRRGRPRLFVSFRCPHCQTWHHHTWNVRPDAAFVGPYHRAAHCFRGPLRPPSVGYLVAPADTPGNRRTLARYAALLAAWEARQKRRLSERDE